MDTLAPFFFLFVALLVGFALFEAHRSRRRAAARQAAESVKAFLGLVDPVLSARHPGLVLWEAKPTPQGGFAAHLVVHPQADPPPLPGWIAQQALWIVRQAGLRDARPLLGFGGLSVWEWARPLGRLPLPSAHAQMAHRHALREALAPHLRPAFDAEPL